MRGKEGQLIQLQGIKYNIRGKTGMEVIPQTTGAEERRSYWFSLITDIVLTLHTARPLWVNYTASTHVLWSTNSCRLQYVCVCMCKPVQYLEPQCTVGLKVLVSECWWGNNPEPWRDLISKSPGTYSGTLRLGDFLLLVDGVFPWRPASF